MSNSAVRVLRNPQVSDLQIMSNSAVRVVQNPRVSDLQVLPDSTLQVVQRPRVYDLQGKDFFATFQLEPEKVIYVGMCGEIILAAPLDDTVEKQVVKTFTLLDDNRNLRNRVMFRSEVKLMKSCNHPNVMKFLTAGESPSYLAYSMHYYQRGTLNRYVGGLSFQLSELYITQVACALRYLHKNHVVHMDVKLENIFMDPDSNPILGDFGLAVKLQAEQLTLETRFCGGTPCYFPPERIGAPVDKELDPYKLDSYSLGVVLWCLAFEKQPTNYINHYFTTKKNKELPDNIRYWLLTLVERNPAKRLTATEILSKVKRESEYRYVIDNF